MLSVAVQAGGQSTRMGENKALKPFLGRPLIERVVKRLEPIADELLITANEPGAFDFLQIRQEPDARPGLGPLSGLHTALMAAHFPIVAVIACDLPFASGPLVVASAGILLHEDADVVIAESPEGYEPLHAVYRRETCLPAIEAAIDSGQRRVISWFPQVKVRKLTDDEKTRYDPDGLAFWNVNTPQEFAEAEQRAKAMEGGRV
jgi:molybdopterin-guanine dinucleotide biosynthesis protein A